MPLGSGTLGSTPIGASAYEAAPPAPAATVTGVTVSPATVALAAGATQQYSATVAGANNPSQGVSWATNLGSVNASGIVTAPAATSVLQTGTVTATSTLDPTKSGTATFTVAAVVVTPPADAPALVERFARPVGDISKGAWQPSSGTDLFPMLDDMAINNSDYISAAGAATCELALAAVRDPGTSANQVVRYLAHAPAGGGLTVELRQGATLIAGWTHATLPATETIHEQALTTQQCDSITNYGDLRIKLVAL